LAAFAAQEEWGAMKYIIVGLATIALMGCQTTELEPAPAPDMQSIVAPAPDVPGDFAAFSGVWIGSWKVAGAPPLDGNLTVRTISATGRVTTSYAVGDAARGQFKAHSTPSSVDITGNTLTLDPFKNGSPTEPFCSRDMHHKQWNLRSRPKLLTWPPKGLSRAVGFVGASRRQERKTWLKAAYGSKQINHAEHDPSVVLDAAGRTTALRSQSSPAVECCRQPAEWVFGLCLVRDSRAPTPPT